MASKAILVINPNTSKSMTEALIPLIDSYFTAKTGFRCIDSQTAADESGDSAVDDLKPLLDYFDAFLIAGYSESPLVPMLKELLPSSKPVLGVLESSIAPSLAWLSQSKGKQSKFGIVTTGSAWNKTMTEAALRFMGEASAEVAVVGDDVRFSSSRFTGVWQTDITAAELHGLDEKLVKERMFEVTRSLVKHGDVGAMYLFPTGFPFFWFFFRRDSHI